MYRDVHASFAIIMLCQSDDDVYVAPLNVMI